MSAPGDAQTVLVVEDNAAILASTVEYLQSCGFNVVSTESSLGVSALVRRCHPALVVLDVMMPALDGGALAKLLEAIPGMKGIPIIFYSASDEDALYRLTKSHPGSSYVMKSDGLPALRAATQQALRGKKK